MTCDILLLFIFVLVFCQWNSSDFKMKTSDISLSLQSKKAPSPAKTEHLRTKVLKDNSRILKKLFDC